MKNHRVLFFAIAILGISTRSAFPANGAWDHGGANDLWSNPVNWTNNVVPGSNDIVTLKNSAPDTPQTVLLDTNVWLNRLDCTATGSRDYTINSTNGASITFLSGHDVYCPTRTTKLTINCDILAALADFQVDRIGGVTILNGNCTAMYLAAQDPGELILGGSNSFGYVRMYDGGEITVKNRNALGLSYFRVDNTNGILSLSTNTEIPSTLYAIFPFILRLKDSGTNDVTLTVGGQCMYDRITIAPNAGTSTGRLFIRLPYNSSHDAEWTLRDNTTLTFANTNATATWGDPANAAVGSVSGPGKVRIESGGEVLVNASNDYTGGTVLQSGTMRLGGHNRLPVAGDLSIQSTGTLYMNSYTQTLARLTGDGIVKFSYNVGTITGGVMVVTDTFAPGATIGTLTCTNHGTLILGPGSKSVFELDSLSGTGDRVLFKNTTSALTLDGTLEIVNLGGLQSGNYTLFDLNGGTLAGDYTTVVVPDGFLGTIDKSTGDVVLKVTKVTLPGALVIVR